MEQQTIEAPTEPVAEQPIAQEWPRWAHHLLTTAMLLVILGLGAVLALKLWPRDTPTDITGTLALIDTDMNFFRQGSTCQGVGGYSDIRGGAAITVRNAKQEIIATGSLLPGKAIIAGICQFDVLVADVPRSSFYVIQLGGGRRGELTYRHDELADIDFKVSFTIGL